MKQCTIVRGNTSNSGILVESNRGYAVKNAESDALLLQNDLPKGQCFPGSAAATMSYW